LKWKEKRLEAAGRHSKFKIPDYPLREIPNFRFKIQNYNCAEITPCVRIVADVRSEEAVVEESTYSNDADGNGAYRNQPKAEIGNLLPQTALSRNRKFFTDFDLERFSENFLFSGLDSFSKNNNVIETCLRLPPPQQAKLPKSGSSKAKFI
jgi:hypothetical protein